MIGTRSPNPEGLIVRAQRLVAAGARGEALDLANELARVPLDRAEWNDAVGSLLTFCEAPIRALPFHERAVALDPGNSLFLYNLAAAQRMSGEFAAAEANLARLIAAAPHDARALYMRADLRTQTVEHNHIEELAARLEERRWHPQGEIMLCFALAKELEDVSRYEESFAYLERGCVRQRTLMRYDVSEDVATLDCIVERHDAVALGVRPGTQTSAAGHPSGADAQCLFVLGLPRSGTTLVERILSSHSAVRSGAESPAFPAETIKAVTRLTGRPIGKREFVARSLEIEPLALGEAYLAEARPPLADGARWVDKQPLNYLYAGLIARALPRARIIALAREPMDSCYAMLKTLFTGAYPFSYNLAELGNYYVAWHRLMRHWQAVLGERLLVVHYEDLVQNQEQVSRRLLAHCGLEWQEACLAFDAQPGAVTSASAVQARRRLYSTSIGKWRRYERQLAPLKRILDAEPPQGGWRFESA
jgi:hypothetical protein